MSRLPFIILIRVLSSNYTSLIENCWFIWCLVQSGSFYWNKNSKRNSKGTSTHKRHVFALRTGNLRVYPMSLFHNWQRMFTAN